MNIKKTDFDNVDEMDNYLREMDIEKERILSISCGYSEDTGNYISLFWDHEY